MDFNQLLQRDLDDHRIAHELVPYILKPQLNGPAFFPPILAALLPFENRRPRNSMPAPVHKVDDVDPEYPDAKWETWTSEDIFRFQLLSGDPLGTGILRWNDERAKLVIMDGQHRAMALLAIHRTITNSWASAASSSERYRAFYEARVRELWEIAEAQGYAGQIEHLEFPVTICHFPDEVGPDRNPHSAARKLFVDVNKEAKPPSESRLILLSDIRLDHVLARELLNRLRDDKGTTLPLYAVEYDNPETKASTPRRWSAVTNLEILLRSVDVCCFGPEDLVTRVDSSTVVKGKPNRRAKSSYFRSQMRLQDVLEASIPDGPRVIDRQELGLELFPVYNKDARTTLLDRFMALWGNGLLRLFSEILPYKAHVDAVRSINEGWGPSPNVASDLAREALFEGVGMFWTLEQGHEYWRELVKKSRQLQIAAPAQTDVSRAWDFVDQAKREEFEKQRAKSYLDGTTTEHITASKQFYGVAITYAAQVGLALTWATLRHANPGADPNSIVAAMISGINRALETGPVASRNRRLIFRKEEKDPFNLLPKLDAPFASFFRAFWLELVLEKDNRAELASAGIDLDSAEALLARARRYYLRAIADEYARSYAQTEPLWTKAQCADKGTELAVGALARAYHKWFGHVTDDARDMLTGLLTEEAAPSDEGDTQATDDVGAADEPT
jgi:hypothetical protein